MHEYEKLQFIGTWITKYKVVCLYVHWGVHKNKNINSRKENQNMCVYLYEFKGQLSSLWLNFSNFLLLNQ